MRGRAFPMTISVRWDSDELWAIEGSHDAPQWADALCRQIDPELFYPEKGGSSSEAKKICLTCPIQERCLEWALARDERFGVWGGLSERERRDLKRRINAGDLADEQRRGGGLRSGGLADKRRNQDQAAWPGPANDEIQHADVRVSCADVRASTCDHPEGGASDRRGTDRHEVLPTYEALASARPFPQGRLAG